MESPFKFQTSPYYVICGECGFEGIRDIEDGPCCIPPISLSLEITEIDHKRGIVTLKKRTK